MRFSRNVFRLGGWYGLLLVGPQYFGEKLIGRLFPPAVTHPEYYYGFVGAIVVWHLAFLVMAKDPARYRALMPIAALEKAAFGVPVLVLFALGRVPLFPVIAALADLAWGALFLVAYWKSGAEVEIGAMRSAPV